MWIIHKHNTSDNLTKKLCIGVHNSPTRALRKNVGEWQPTKGKQRTSRRINDTVDRYNNQQARVVRINNIRGNPRTTYVLPSQCWPRWWLWWLRPQRQWSCASKDRVSCGHDVERRVQRTFMSFHLRNYEFDKSRSQLKRKYHTHHIFCWICLSITSI